MVERRHTKILIMQHRYVGDIGDYIKLALLRAISPGHRLGVAWWLYPDEDHNSDGRHVSYLEEPGEWRRFDPPVYDALAGIVASGDRHVRALENSYLIPNAVYHGTVYPTTALPQHRQAERARWFGGARETTDSCDIVFVDPDNGLQPDGYNPHGRTAGKSIELNELRMLSRPGRCLVVYHHQTRRKGGHLAEIAHWNERLQHAGLGSVAAVRARPYSPRVFFLLNAPEGVLKCAERLTETWRDKLTWHD